MKIKQHKESGLWVTDDGRVIQPPCRKYTKFRFTYGCLHHTGYMVVSCHGKQYRVHKLVIEAFVENKLGLPTVDHINRNKLDNRLENLRYGSYRLQADNKQIVEDSLSRYGVRSVEDRNAYRRAVYAENPEYGQAKSRKYYANNAEQCRARKREYYANNAERCRASSRKYRAKNIERERAKCREWREKQRSLGRRPRKCPDGKIQWLSDAEYDARYKGNAND